MALRLSPSRRSASRGSAEHDVNNLVLSTCWADALSFEPLVDEVAHGQNTDRAMMGEAQAGVYKGEGRVNASDDRAY
ncbi:hypothetical protein HPP92_007087 [Vanilla planifolia]|uniref:Uncharacterized protein n=1 Tax=Vanilla planifolia TaxID=51239 RepID=A0A835V9R1_VANPL|nr:hypothetical protein HPP92_007087 [Vanilla planifolia]